MAAYSWTALTKAGSLRACGKFPGMKITSVAMSALFAAFPVLTQNSQARYIPETDSSYIDAEGTAHVTRVVPVPDTISPEAKQFLEDLLK